MHMSTSAIIQNPNDIGMYMGVIFRNRYGYGYDSTRPMPIPKEKFDLTKERQDPKASQVENPVEFLVETPTRFWVGSSPLGPMFFFSFSFFFFLF